MFSFEQNTASHYKSCDEYEKLLSAAVFYNTQIFFAVTP